MGVIKKVLANVVQALTDAEKTQARQNIGAGTGTFQTIVFTLDTSPFANPTSATCDKSYDDILTGWGFRNELPIARLSWSGSGNKRIYASRFETDESNAEIRFEFVMYGGLLLELRYKSNGTIAIATEYHRYHAYYEEYRILQNDQGAFSRNFNWDNLHGTLSNATDGSVMTRLEYPHILIQYNHDADPTRSDYLLKLDFVKCILDTVNNTVNGYQFSCAHRAKFGEAGESSELVTYTIWRDNTDSLNAYTL